MTATAQTPGATPQSRTSALTAIDYIEIQQLVARYARTIDSCSNNGYDYADLYLPDGWFNSSRNGAMVLDTRGAIASPKRPAARHVIAPK